MNTTTLASPAPAPAVPSSIEAELGLRLLSAVHNPLPGGGTLTLIASGEPRPQQVLDIRSTTHDTGLVALGPSRTLTLLLEFSGLHLLRVDLEVLPLVDEEQERIEVIVRSQGVAANDAFALTLDATAYSWRLSGQVTPATLDGAIHLAFELVQERELTTPFDPLATARLPFTALTDGDHQARIKVKRSGMGSVITP